MKQDKYICKIEIPKLSELHYESFNERLYRISAGFGIEPYLVIAAITQRDMRRAVHKLIDRILDEALDHMNKQKARKVREPASRKKAT